MKAERKDQANQPDETPESDTSAGQPVEPHGPSPAPQNSDSEQSSSAGTTEDELEAKAVGKDQTPESAALNTELTSRNRQKPLEEPTPTDAESPQQPTESVQSATPSDSSRWVETEEDRQLIDKFDRAVNGVPRFGDPFGGDPCSPEDIDEKTIDEEPPEESHEESRSEGTNEASPEDTDEESVTKATDFAEIAK